MRFSIDQLLAFVMTVESGSFSETARRLGKAQSAVSAAVINLELDLGVTLFNRSGRYPKITDAGSVIYREAREILTRCQELERRSDAISEGVDDSITFVIDELVPSNFNAKTLIRFSEVFPSVELELILSVGNEVYELMINGVAFLGVAAITGKKPDGINYRLIANLKRVAVVSVNHPLARKEIVTKLDLEAHRQLVLYNRKGKIVYDGAKLSKDQWKLDSYFVIWDFVRKGLGWAWLPYELVQKDFDKNILKPLTIEFVEADIYVPLYLLWHEELSLGPAGRWLLDEFSALGKDQDLTNTFDDPWG